MQSSEEELKGNSSCRILVDIRRILMEGSRGSLTDEYGEKRGI